MAPPRIQLSTPGNPIASCESDPQLMPFHIAYSGPAPIATFFRVQELEEENVGDKYGDVTSDGAEKSNSSSANGVEVSKTTTKTKAGLGKRLVAAFRGRRVVGVEVPLPEGYTGVVLRSSIGKKPAKNLREDEGMNGKSKLRRKLSTRGNQRTRPIELNNQDEATLDTMELDDENLALNGVEDGREVKTLQATQTFRSIVVWNPDFVVDEGRDEYMRALREWTSVASEVHRMED